MNETQYGQSEMTVADKLKALYELQSTLSQIDKIRVLRGELPKDVEELKAEIAGLDVRMERLQKELRQLDEQVARMKEERRVAEGIIERNTSQLDEVRNNREFDSLNKEIEYQQLEIQLRDKRIREAGYRREELQAQVSDSLAHKNECIENLQLKESELDTIISDTKVQEDALRETSKELEFKIEPRLLMAYNRIRKSVRNGLGIVCVQRDACGGCFNKIPPQRQLDVRMRKKVIVCEYCGRILIDPELAGVEVVKTEEKAPKKSRARAKKTTEE